MYTAWPQGDQPQGMLTGHVLFGLFLVAALTCCDGGKLRLVRVVLGLVKRPVTSSAIEGFGHFAPLEVRHLHGRYLDMAFLAF